MSDEANLHLLQAIGNTLVEEGPASGSFPGTLKARLNIDAARGTARATFTLYRPGGMIYGHSSGHAETAQGGWESFSGKLRLQGGTGEYEHASGTGTMSGAINRRTDRVKAQESGTLRY